MGKLSNPKETIEVIQKYEFAFQKKFGQNFLIDGRVLDKIIAAANVDPEDFVLEIGPGIGTMTQYLAEHAREVVAVERRRTALFAARREQAVHSRRGLLDVAALPFVRVVRLRRFEHVGVRYLAVEDPFSQRG